MFRRVSLIIYIAACMAAPAWSQEPFRHRIIMLGNSITSGKGSDDGRGFRDELYYKLVELGFPFSFVGSTGVNPFKGHFKPGAVIGDFYDGPGGNASFHAGADMNKFRPTMAIIHLGTNDFWLGGDISPYSYDGGQTFGRSISGRLGHLIEFLLQWHDGTKGTDLEKIFVCKIIPKRNKHVLQIVEFNDAVEDLVNAANNGELPMVPPGILKLVDQHSTFDIKTMLSLDGTHPTGKGYLHMANVFLDAIKTLPLYIEPAGPSEIEEYAFEQIKDSLVVKVSDGFDAGVPHVPVTFRVEQGDAVIVGSRTVYTDSSGMAALDSLIMGSADSCMVCASSPGLIDSTARFTLKPRQYRNIAGSVVYHISGIPVANTVLHCTGAIGDTAVSDESGEYVFNIPLEQDSIYIVPAKERTSIHVLAYDAALIARHVAGIDTLKSVTAGAADVDGDGAVTINDAFVLLNHVVGIDTINNYIGEWVFTPDTMRVDSIKSDTSLQTIYAAVRGDVHGGWGQPVYAGLFSVTVGKTVQSETDGGNAYLVPVYIQGDSIVSAQLNIQYNAAASEIDEIIPVNSHTQARITREHGTAAAGLMLTNAENLNTSVPVCFIRMKAGSVQYARILIKNALVNGTTADIRQQTTDVPADNRTDTEFSMMPAYPNPFNSACTVSYLTSRPEKITVSVFDVTGRAVAILYNGMSKTGINRLTWNGCDDSGQAVTSGMYIIRLNTDSAVYVNKVQLIR